MSRDEGWRTHCGLSNSVYKGSRRESSLGGAPFVEHQIVRELHADNFGWAERQAIPHAEFPDFTVGVYIYICATQRWVQRTRRACTCETLEGVEERMPGRGCRRFEVALILSRQGGDYSCSIVLRVHRFGMPYGSAWCSSVKMFRLAPPCVTRRRGTSGFSFLWSRMALDKIVNVYSCHYRAKLSDSHCDNYLNAMICEERLFANKRGKCGGWNVIWKGSDNVIGRVIDRY